MTPEQVASVIASAINGQILDLNIKRDAALTDNDPFKAEHCQELATILWRISNTMHLNIPGVIVPPALQTYPPIWPDTPPTHG